MKKIFLLSLFLFNFTHAAHRAVEAGLPGLAVAGSAAAARAGAGAGAGTAAELARRLLGI